MSDEKALLAAIWEHPHDDTPRLVYADWLDEHDRPERAEFIRLQCERARLGWYDPCRPALKAREREIYGNQLRAPVVGLDGRRTKVLFHRGFPYPEPIGLGLNRFLALTAADFAPAPLWSVGIERAGAAPQPPAASPNLRRVDRLGLDANALDERVAADVFGSPNLVNVSRLSFTGCTSSGALWLEQRAARALAAVSENESLRHLRELCFTYAKLTDEGFAPLAGSSRLAGVLSLALYNNRITERSIRLLAGSPHTAGLTSLHLNSNPLGDGGAGAVVRSGWRLDSLDLSSTGLTDGGAAELACWPGLGSIISFSAGNNPLGPAAAKALADSPHWHRAVRLRFPETPLQRDEKAVKLLRDRFGDRLSFGGW